MTEKRTNGRSGGGAATSTGISFQENIACYFSTLILAETNAEPPAGLPQWVHLVDIQAESLQPIDDLRVRTSAEGVLYIQSKTSLSLSNSLDSEFAKVIDQFVRQRINGVRTYDGKTRPVDPNRDRFILAVGYGAPGTLTETLSDLLSKCRTVSDEAQLAEVTESLNHKEKDALATIRSHIQRLWNSVEGTPSSVTDELSVLHMVYVIQFDLRDDGAEYVRAKDLLRQVVLRDATKAGDAWNALVNICRDFGPQRTGGDLDYLRNQILKNGIPIHSVPSYREDITTLRNYTDNRIDYLKRHSFIELGGRSIEIAREFSDTLVAFSEANHTLLVGEPGAGKSGCLSILAGRLQGLSKDVVLLAADMMKSASPEELATDLGLSKGRSLVEVLQNWSGDGIGFLIIDALDAARSGMNLQVLCRVLREVKERANRWHIIASVREYDLRVSSELQELFEGEPDQQFRDPRFLKIRHIQIGRLSTTELSQVSNQHEAVRTVIESAPKLLELIRNPFNLSLLCKLLDQNLPQPELRSVRTQNDLLRLYWNRRVQTDTEIERLVVLDKAVALMVGHRELHVSRLELARSVSTNVASIDVLLREGVFVELPSRSVSGSKLAFAHNILFDYSVCRLWLDELSDEVVSNLSEPGQHVLLLAIYPSIVMAFEELWDSDDSRSVFWERAIACENSPGMRLVGKVIGPGVAAQLLCRVGDLTPLLLKLAEKDGRQSALVRYTIQAAIAQSESTTVSRSIVGEDAPEWMALAAELSNDLDKFAWDVRFLLLTFIKDIEKATIEQTRFANRSAVALLQFGLENSSSYYRLVRTGVEAVVLTFSSAPELSANALEAILCDENVTLGGHDWLPAITNRLDLIAFSDADFAVRIVDVVFRASGDRNSSVPMGSRILTMSFNKHDMVEMAKHNVQQVYSTIWEHSPVTATRIFLTIIKCKLETDYQYPSASRVLHRISFRGRFVNFVPDDSHLWSVGGYNQDEEWHQVLAQFQTGLMNVAKSMGYGASIGSILDVLRDEAEYAVVWRALLEAAAEEPDTLGIAVGELLASPEVLSDYNTRHAAGLLIANGYQYFSIEARIAIENAIISIPNILSEHQFNRAEYRRNIILGCIPTELIHSSDLRRVRRELDAEECSPPNVPLVSISTSWNVVDETLVVSSESVDETQIRELCITAKQIPNVSQQSQLTASIAADFLCSLETIENEIKLRQELGFNSSLIQNLEYELLDACQRLTCAKGLRREMPVTQFLKRILRNGSHSLYPEHRPEDDERWDNDLLSWNSCSPRVDAALGLMRLAAYVNSVDEEILTDIERLSFDTVPAVRFQVLCNLTWLYHSSPTLMWSLVENTCKHEPRSGILTRFSNSVLLRIPSTEFRLTEPLMRHVYRRTRRNDKFKQVRGASATFYLRGVLWHADNRSRRYLRVFAESPLSYSVEISKVVEHCRDLIRHDESESNEENKSVRAWTFAYLTSVLNAVKDGVIALKNSHSDVLGDQWSKEDIEKLRLFHQIADSVTKQVYIGTGAFDERSSTNQDSGKRKPPTDAEKALMLSEGSDLFDALCDVEFVDSAYDVLQTLEFLIGADHRRILLRIARVVRCSMSDGIQFESMAAERIVRIVERYLSEYGNLFRESDEARGALLDILDVFVGAGWPEATRLTYRLGEVFR